ncbi:MAG TPA: CdaR family protein [Haliangiales bacterium]|nr:CdaR family protein [Haliangiales bacterium]
MTRALREYIPEHFGWKLTSVGVAVLIWLAINFNIQGSFRSSESRAAAAATTTATSRLPVTVITTATDLRVFTITPSEVEVTVRGEERVLDGLKKTDVQAFVNLIDVKDTKSFSKKVIVHTPLNVTAIRVVPDEVTVDRVSPEPSNNPRNQD